MGAPRPSGGRGGLFCEMFESEEGGGLRRMMGAMPAVTSARVICVREGL